MKHVITAARKRLQVTAADEGGGGFSSKPVSRFYLADTKCYLEVTTSKAGAVMLSLNDSGHSSYSDADCRDARKVKIASYLKQLDIAIQEMRALSWDDSFNLHLQDAENESYDDEDGVYEGMSNKEIRKALEKEASLRTDKEMRKDKDYQEILKLNARRKIAVKQVQTALELLQGGSPDAATASLTRRSRRR